MAPFSAVSELSDTARTVLQSLRERPTLNTVSLMATGPVIPEGVDGAAIEAALAELEAAGLAKHRPTGWKAVPQPA